MLYLVSNPNVDFIIIYYKRIERQSYGFILYKYQIQYINTKMYIYISILLIQLFFTVSINFVFQTPLMFLASLPLTSSAD